MVAQACNSSKAGVLEFEASLSYIVRPFFSFKTPSLLDTPCLTYTPRGHLSQGFPTQEEESYHLCPARWRIIFL
jgi:hypothetical protein